MKLIHLSDLHLGKRVNEFSMLEDQKYILKKILNIINEQSPDALLIAGDIYDKSVPLTSAVQLFDDFLCRLAKRGLQVFIISGNHDSAERMAFGGRLMDISGIHMSPVYNGEVEPFRLKDEHGNVNIYMLPFIKPANVRRFFPDGDIVTYTDALALAVKNMPLDTSARNVLITHQFVTGAVRSESEELSVGGSDNVDASVFDDFDYVALGHIHSPQKIGRETVRYCGTPLKYSFSEVSHKKSVTVVELGEKGDISINTIPLTPLHDMREIKGTYLEITDRRSYKGTDTDDYIHITLTDEEDIPDAIGKLRVIYPNLMKLDYDNKRTRKSSDIGKVQDVGCKTPLELFAELYEKQNNQPINEEQLKFMNELIEKAKEAEE